MKKKIDRCDQHKKNLKISKGQSDSVNGRTDNTFVKGKGTKGQTTIYKTKHRKKDRVTRTPLKTGVELRCSGNASSFCFPSDTRHVTLITNHVISHELGKERIL